MTIYSNRACIGPDGQFVDSGSQIPDAWVTEHGEWVDARITKKDFVDGEPAIPDPPLPPAMQQAADATVHVNAGRDMEARQ